MSKMSKACDISTAVRRAVWARDDKRCIFCGNPNAKPNMHYISRAKGGMGIEENIGTGCAHCHHLLDNEETRPEMMRQFRDYLFKRYRGWNEESLIVPKLRQYHYNKYLED